MVDKEMKIIEQTQTARLLTEDKLAMVAGGVESTTTSSGVDIFIRSDSDENIGKVSDIKIYIGPPSQDDYSG